MRRKIYETKLYVHFSLDDHLYVHFSVDDHPVVEIIFTPVEKFRIVTDTLFAIHLQVYDFHKSFLIHAYTYIYYNTLFAHIKLLTIYQV